MADPRERLPLNAPGKFYVDSSCIDCDLCRTTVPEIFRRDPVTGFSFVNRQPGTPEETAQAQAALNDCPTESIGCEVPV
jgi:ferredoxin